MECVKIALEHFAEVHKGAHEVLLIRPLAARVENFRGHARARTWNLQGRNEIDFNCNQSKVRIGNSNCQRMLYLCV